MSDTYDTVFQTQDLEGTLHWLGDQESRDRLDNVYTKTESDAAFRRIDDSYSSNDINDMFMSKADKADVYTINETDTLLSDLEDRTRTTFANIHATFVQFQSDVDVHFQAIDNDIDALPNTYYNKTEVNAIAEELDRTKQNTLVSDGSILLIPQTDGTVQIGNISGTSIIDDSSSANDRVWSAEKSSTEFSTANSELDSLSTAQSEVDSTQNSEIASLSTAESELDSEISRFESEVASDYIQISSVDTGMGLFANSSSAYVKVDGTSIDFNSSGEIYIPNSTPILHDVVNTTYINDANVYVAHYGKLMQLKGWVQLIGGVALPTSTWLVSIGDYTADANSIILGYTNTNPTTVYRLWIDHGSSSIVLNTGTGFTPSSNLIIQFDATFLVTPT